MERKRGPKSTNRLQVEGQAGKSAAVRREAEPKRWRADELLGNAREAVIEHGTELYRLRLTSNNKLILTK